jgi:hypothetical protein
VPNLHSAAEHVGRETWWRRYSLRQWIEA